MNSLGQTHTEVTAMKEDLKQDEVLLEVENALAIGQPFGDWRYIEGRLWMHYESRLKILGEYFPTAHILGTALQNKSTMARRKVLGDPIVRSAIDNALCHFKMGQGHVHLGELQEILSLANECVSNGSNIAPFDVGGQPVFRIGAEDYHGWVWHNERIDDACGRHFRRLFELHLGGAGLSLRTPNNKTHQTIIKGARLLSQLLPDLARSALSHVRLVAVIDHPPGFTSVTNPNLMGCVFFAPGVLNTPWQAAEYLLHEAMHLKFIDLEHTHSMLRHGYKNAESIKVRPLWNRPDPFSPQGWPANRVLTVLHVYTCLALFFISVERRAKDLLPVYGFLGELQPAVSSRRAFDRAQYLANKAREADYDLGDAGRSFVQWLKTILQVFDPSPPLEKAYVHLLLDRYEREANELGKLTNGENRAAVLETASLDNIQAMIANEIGYAQRIHRLLDGHAHTAFNVLSELIPKESSQCPIAPEDRVRQFLRVREYVSQAVKNVPPEQLDTLIDGQDSETLDALVLEMVDQSGLHFDAIMRRIGERIKARRVQHTTVTSISVTVNQPRPAMEHKRLGKTDLSVSAIGFGALHLSLNNRLPTREAMAVIHRALDLGITLIDTADVYCIDESDKNHNERLIFKAFQHYSGDTEHVIVATKGGMLRPNGAWTRNGDPKHIRKAIRASFEALGGERTIGLWQYHVPDPNFPIEQSLQPVKEAQEEGLIRYIGVSNFTVDQINRARDVVEIVSVQGQYNPWHRWPEYDGVLEYCEQKKLTFIAWSPLGGQTRVSRLSDMLPLEKLATDKAVSVYCLVLAWLRSKSPNIIPIPGTCRSAGVEDSIRAVGIHLTPDETASIDQLFG